MVFNQHYNHKQGKIQLKISKLLRIARGIFPNGSIIQMYL